MREKGAEVVQCRDGEGRQSTALHFAAGYNRIDVLHFLSRIGLMSMPRIRSVLLL